jgi:succinate dehydrogenase / fumarate reductase cytochrome b subunit
LSNVQSEPEAAGANGGERPGPDAAPARGARRTLLARLNTFCAVVPLGAFLAVHTALNARMVYGRRAFNETYLLVQDAPWLPVAEWLLVGAPLAFHAVYGLVVTLRGGVSVRRDPSLRSWLAALHRATGVFALVFLGVHVWQYRAQRALRGVPWVELYQRLGVDLGAPTRYALYAAGLTATVYHFACGLHAVAQRTSLARSPEGVRRLAWACGLAGVLLWALGINTLLHFAVSCGGVLPLPGRHAAHLCGAFGR